MTSCIPCTLERQLKTLSVMRTCATAATAVACDPNRVFLRQGSEEAKIMLKGLLNAACIASTGTMLCGEALGPEDSFAMLDHADSLGIRTWDTAEMYPVPQAEATVGRSEELLGRWLQQRGHPRGDHAIVTKVAGPGNMPWLRGGPLALDSDNILTAAEGSLRRLACHHIDCLLLHWPDRYVPMFGEVDFDPTRVYTATPLTEQLLAIQQLLDSGKIRTWGLSNETPWGITHATAAARAAGVPPPAMVQNAYNLLCRTADAGVAEACHMEGVPFVGYSPLAMGLLAGGYRRSDDGIWLAGPEKRLVRYGPRPNVAAALERYAEIANTMADTPADSCRKHRPPPAGSAAATAAQARGGGPAAPSSEGCGGALASEHARGRGEGASGGSGAGAALAQLSIKWALQRPGVSGLVVGARTRQQLTQLVQAAEDGGALCPEVLQAIDRVHEQFPSPCP